MSTIPPHLYRRAWLAWFGLLRRYFRFQVEGFEHLCGGRSALLVGYHGMPHPLDVFMLSVEVERRLGYVLPAIWLDSWGKLPLLREMVPALNGFLGRPGPDEMRDLLACGRHLVVLPGGSREGLRPFWRRYTLDWGARRGYLDLARAFDLPIVPMAASGVDGAWLGLNDGYRLSKRLFGHGGVPLWLGLGVGGLWPVAPPWPVRIRLRIGPPLDVRGLEPEEADRRVRAAVQGLLDELRQPSSTCRRREAAGAP